MAKNPSPSADPNAPKEWEAPASDQEFVFESMDAAPAWVDKSWASFSMGPAIAVPAGDLFGTGPYTTKIGRIGDTIKFIAATPSKPAHFEVIEGEPVGDNATLKIPQVTNASLEDMLRTGVMTPDDLGPDAKGQVAARSPGMAKLVEENKNAPKAIPIDEVMKIS